MYSYLIKYFSGYFSGNILDDNNIYINGFWGNDPALHN